jgi:hypothetical protein
MNDDQVKYLCAGGTITIEDEAIRTDLTINRRGQMCCHNHLKFTLPPLVSPAPVSEASGLDDLADGSSSSEQGSAISSST